MRRMSDEAAGRNASFIDGVQIKFNNDWVLVLPDPHRPLVHVVAEAGDADTAERLASEYRERVRDWKSEVL